MYLAELYFLI